MDCRYCEIQVEITKRAYAARCPDPVAVLDYIREKMNVSTRPRVDLADMKRARTVALEEQITMSDHKESDLITTAAKAIGSTLGKIAVKTGIAKPPVKAAKVRKKVAPAVKGTNKKVTKKTPAAKGATGVKGKRTAKKAAPQRKQSK